MRTAYDANGTDWVEVVIPPEVGEEANQAEYVVKVNMSFMLSNWECIYGRGCPGCFGDQDTTYPDDTGCCGDSFYMQDKPDRDRIEQRIKELTPEDWDDDLRKYVEKHGWYSVRDNSDDYFSAKGKVIDGGCVFQNRNGGSSGKPGCAFVQMTRRTGGDHIDVMPTVCWMLPLRLNEVEDNVYELTAWTIDQWHTEEWRFEDQRWTHRWWCIDSPEAYIGESVVFKTMERELRHVLGDREYDLIEHAINIRLEQGWKPMPMPGAVVNDGRPLLPLLIGNREPRRQPSPYPAILEGMRQQS